MRPFGFGLSYTRFEWSDFRFRRIGEGAAEVSLTVRNTGLCDGDEAVQLCLSQTMCDVSRPLREMKAYRRVHVPAGGSVAVALTLGERDLSYYDSEMNFGLHPSHNRIIPGADAKDEKAAFEFDILR